MVSKYAKEAVIFAPEIKDCQWLLQLSDGAYAWDWNCSNHSSIIDFYKEIIDRDNEAPPTPLPYYYLIDNLIADRRTKEAREYLHRCKTLTNYKPFLLSVFEAHIALAEYDEKEADGIMESALSEFAGDAGFIFEKAQYHARKCEYEKAIEYYERSWKTERDSKPRFTDALFGIATIYEIIGNRDKALETYDRVIDCLMTEWGYDEDDAAVTDTYRKKKKILAL